MANLRPFHGVLYNQESVGNIRDVVGPPYDVIDTGAQKALYARHPHNVIRLELGLDQPGDGPSENRYTRAAQHLQAWLEKDVLRRDPQPAIYPCMIDYRVPGQDAGQGRGVLKGFLAVMELEEFGAGRVLPHENTRAAAKNDRFRLLDACHANFSPIFSLFSDPENRIFMSIEKAIGSQKPRIDFEDDEGFRQRLWAITDPERLRNLAAALKPKPLFIADGHHRYETALAYRKLRREQAGCGAAGSWQPWDGVLMLCASLEDPGLTVLPTHRVLKRPLAGMNDIREKLRDAFSIEEIPFAAETEPEARARFVHSLRQKGLLGQAFGLTLKDVPRYFVLALRSHAQAAHVTSPRDGLDVSVLHAQILTPLSVPELSEDTVLYTKDDDEALDLVRGGEAEAAFLLNPTKVAEVSAVASAGERMPHKSTYFFPKPLTGLVMHVMEEDHP